MNCATLNLFGSPDLLRGLKPELLLAWLAPARGYLAGRGFAWPSGPRAQMDYEGLSRLLLEPTPDIPASFVDSLCLVQGMACRAGMETILAHAEETGLDLRLGPDPTPADVAVSLWLEDPPRLECLHNRRQMLRPRQFLYFMASTRPLPDFAGPDAAQLAELQARLNEFYLAWRRGPGARVFAYRRDHEWWFLVRHGAPFRREAALEHGEPTTILYRPQEHDVLVYDPRRGEMRVNCCGSRERTVLLRHFGRCLFGQPDFFPSVAKYTLAPLVHRGRDCLACADIPGIARVRLTRVEFYHRGTPWERITRKAEDIFDLIDHRKLQWPACLEEITRATFEFTFWRSKRPCQLTLVPCNQAECSRAGDIPLLSAWLERRQFAAAAETGTPIRVTPDSNL